MKTKNRFILIILLMLVSFSTQSQSHIQQIRKWYQEVKKEISFSQKYKFEGSLYCDITEKNINRASWRAVGTYYSKVQFWYNDDPSLMQDAGENPRACLEMVIENTESSVNKYYIEYLYHNGELVFVFYKVNAEEMRFYYQNHKLIKQLGKIENYPPTAKEMIEKSEQYMKSFFANLGVN